jgi:4-hydroxybenzoate polyprenyltransferase
MTTNNIIWVIFGIITLISLIIFFKKRNAVWGGFTIGIIIGLTMILPSIFHGVDINWLTLIKATIVSTMIGLIAELLGKISDYIQK